MTKKSQKAINKKLFGIWSFDKSTIQTMKDLTLKTKLDKKEHGGLLCSNENNKLRLENKCDGDTCSLTYKNNTCNEFRKRIGTFHTHPSLKQISLSLRDIQTSIEYNDTIDCLGTPNVQTDKITCYTRKSNTDKYWNEVNKNRNKLNEIKIIEDDVSLIRKNPSLYDKLHVTEKIRINNKNQQVIKFVDKYQKKFLKQFNPEDYVAED